MHYLPIFRFLIKKKHIQEQLKYIFQQPSSEIVNAGVFFATVVIFYKVAEGFTIDIA